MKNRYTKWIDSRIEIRMASAILILTLQSLTTWGQSSARTMAVGTPSAPALMINFDFSGTDYLRDKIKNVTGTSPDVSQLKRITGHDNVANSAVNFRGATGTGTALGRINLPTDTLVKYMDPTGDGYTIACWVQTTSNTLLDDRQIFWATNGSGDIVSGFKRRKNFMSLNRYIDLNYQNTYWSMDTWKPDLFLPAGGWHKIFMSVTLDKIMIKVYQPGDTFENTNWGPQGLGGHNELSYMGGQKLKNKVTQFGFGANSPKLAITALDNFRVYDRAITFSEMDAMYTTETGSEGDGGSRVANPETVTAIKENKDPGISVYPNPTSAEFIVEANDAPPQSEIVLLNALGVSLIRKPFDSKSEVIDVRALPAGMYFLKVSGPQTNAVYKVMKK